MRDDVRRNRWRHLAWCALLAMAVVVGASAWLRLAHGPCPDSVRCDVAAAASPSHGTAAVRAAHRVAASTVLVLVVGLLVLARGAPAAGVRALAWPLLALALALAALGVVTPGSRSAAVMLGNLLGGLSMFALTWALVRRLRERPPPSAGARRAAGLAAALWGAQAAVGALAGTAASPWTAAGLLHLALAAVGLPLAAGIGIALTRQALRGEGIALLAVASLQAGLGGLALLADAPAPVVAAHNATAAAGLALLAGVAFGRAAPQRG